MLTPGRLAGQDVSLTLVLVWRTNELGRDTQEFRSD